MTSHDWERHGSRLHIEQILQDWLGPTLAILRCGRCGQPALLFLLAWQGQRLDERIFGIRALQNRDTSTYLASINRDYCDLTRKSHETESLIQRAAPETVLVKIRLPDFSVLITRASDITPAVADWQTIQRTAWDEWIARLTS